MFFHLVHHLFLYTAFKWRSMNYGYEHDDADREAKVAHRLYVLER